MTYQLLHKDKTVLSFSLDSDYSILPDIIVHDSKLIPIGTTIAESNNLSDKIDYRKLNIWWKNRTIPTGRKNLEYALNLLKVHSIEELISKTHSLNLTDHYWIKQENEVLSWNEINFFQNDFDSSIGKYLMTEKARTFSNGTYDSPDLFTDGILPKQWIIMDGQRFLLKGTESFYQQEPFNEVLASHICEKIGLPHAEYALSKISDDTGTQYYSLCRNFINVKTELISAYDITNVLKKKNNESIYQHFIRCCNTLGLKNFEENLHKMLFVDFIVANTDRHLRNFSFIRNADTLEWIGLAPIYDTERSLFLNKASLKDSYGAIDIDAKPFKDNQAEQFNLLNKDFLKTITFENLNSTELWFNRLLKENEYIPEERNNKLCELLKDRIESGIYLVHNNKKIAITKNKHKRELEYIQGLSLIAVPI